MPFIPFKALKFGALNLFPEKIKYGKSRVSGSKKISYIMCSKAGVMPGQRELFCRNYLSKPLSGEKLSENEIISDYKFRQNHFSKKPKGEKYYKYSKNGITFFEYSPHDDEAYKLAIESSYRQIFGNFHAMESERPRDSERRLRNGDITIKEFIRKLAKSNFYKFHYFESVNQQRAMELNFKHLLGRAPHNQQEVINSVKIINENGLEGHIDSLIDSQEYNEIFGEYIVPYPRCWNSPYGSRASNFINYSKLSTGFAVSDNSSNVKYQGKNGGASLILNTLATVEIY